MKKLLRMLTYKRPMGSPAELSFLKRYVYQHAPKVVEGNLIITVPGDTETMFSCHTDTVHHKGGEQIVIYDEQMKQAYKDDKEPLGADDTSGVWLMLEMIKAKIPGVYFFHYGEEKGCVGSRALAEKRPDLIRQFRRAVAFDRRGKDHVITHQASQRCCSEEFATALGDAIGMGYGPDSTGVYTDTASYTRLIPECTNLSVGYEHQHSHLETQDVGHLMLLREAVMTVNWKALPTVRDHTAKPVYKPYGGRYQGSANSHAATTALPPAKLVPWNAQRNYLSTLVDAEVWGDDAFDLIELADKEIGSLSDVQFLIYREPALAARMLYAYNLTNSVATLRERLNMKKKESVVLPFPKLEKKDPQTPLFVSPGDAANEEHADHPT